MSNLSELLRETEPEMDRGTSLGTGLATDLGTDLGTDLETDRETNLADPSNHRFERSAV